MQTQPTTKTLLTAAGLAAALSLGMISVEAEALEDRSARLAEPGIGFDPGPAALLGGDGSLGVDWAALFQRNGYGPASGRPDFVDLHGGIEALVLEDNFSAGVAIDMSAYAGAERLADSLVYNGTVAAEHDLGNVYVYANLDAGGNLMLYAGIERLLRAADSRVDIEFNQDRVGVAGGVPWPLRGRRTNGDLSVRANLLAGEIDSVEVRVWIDGAFEVLGVYGGLAAAGCNGEPGVVLFCGTEPRFAVPRELWDADGNRVESIPSQRLLEIGVNVGRLLGRFIEYSAIQVKTPEDIVLGAFRTTGYWARRLNHGK
jgi:hypothetical protein